MGTTSNIWKIHQIYGKSKENVGTSLGKYEKIHQTWEDIGKDRKNMGNI